MRVPVTRLAQATWMAAVWATLSCGGDGGMGPPAGDRVTLVSVTPSAPALIVGQSVQLSATVFDQDERVTTQFPVTWTSLAPGVATVTANGLVTGVAEGSATIRATAGGETGDAIVTVSDPDPPGAAPTDVVATVVSSSEVDLVWVDNSDDEEFFRIDREEVAAGVVGDGHPAVFAEVATAPANSTSFRDAGLAGGTTYRYVVRACTVGGCTPPSGSNPPASTSEAVTTEPEPLALDDSPLPPAVTGQPYSRDLVANGGLAAKSWEVAPGSEPLPPGIALSEAGELAGTPTLAGDFTFTVRVTSGEQEATGEVSLTVIRAVEILTSNLANAVLGEPYLSELDAIGGSGTIRWTLAPESDPMPSGLTVTLDGFVEGTATEEGTFTPTFRAATGSIADTRQIPITVSAPTFTLDAEHVVGGSVGFPYSDVLDVTGSGPFTFRIVEGGLPDGLELDIDTGEISGTPTTAGAVYFTVEVAAGGDTSIRTFAMAISNNPPEEFNMEILNVAGVGVPAQDVIDGLSAALARWEEVITDDLPAVTFGEGAFPFEPNSKLNGEIVDDMVVMVNLAPIDGSGGVLGSAGPRSVRFAGPPTSTVFGRLTLDVADLGAMDPARKLALTFHEIGHIVGIGTLWDDDFLISGAGTSDPRYEGAGGNGVFVTQLGGGSAGAARIPIEGEFGGGTRDSHWDEGEFNTEVMTGFLEPNGIFMAVSAMTIASVGDLNYEVDESVADPYAVPPCAPSCVSPPLVVAEGAEVALDDIERAPVYLVTREGRVEGVVIRDEGGSPSGGRE